MAKQGVGACAFRIIRRAVGLRYDAGEGSIKELVSIYNRLTDTQAQEIIDYYKALGKE